MDVGGGVVGVTAGRGVAVMEEDKVAVAVGVVEDKQAFRKKTIVTIRVANVMFLTKQVVLSQ